MRKTSVTSTDVARLAGVSQSAVSRAFSRVRTQSGVSKATREKVLKAAAELGYRPNAVARSSLTERSGIVGVLFSYLDNPFYANALELLCDSLQTKGYHALVFMMADGLSDADATVSEILQCHLEGVITASVELSSEICADCHEQGIPVVMLNRIQDDSRLSSVTTDNVAGGRMAARAFLDAGHERIALLAGWEGASTSRDRELGFEAELTASGATLFAREVGHFDLAQAADATRRLFNRPAAERPDALFVVNDHMAIRAMDVIRHELGLRIPEDVSVIGFDDTALAALPAYGLTTVRQPVTQMVETALQLLFDRIKDESVAPEHVILGARLVERTSVRTLATAVRSRPVPTAD